MNAFLSFLLFAVWGGAWYGIARLAKSKGVRPWLSHVAGAPFGLIAAGIVVGIFLPSQEPTQTAITPATGRITPSPAVGNPLQMEFEKARASFYRRYEAADNEIKKSAVFIEANKTTGEFVQKAGFIAERWTGKLTDLSTDQGGEHAWIKVESKTNGTDVVYMTWNNALSDLDDKTSIQKGTDLYRKLADLKEGDKVVFTARFLSDPRKGARESSMTELGSVSEPNFIMRFIDISKAQ